MPKTWRKGGTEDKFIKKLIKSGKIHRFSKPQKLITDHPEIFSGFTANVVRNHLNLLKRENGLYRKLHQIFEICHRRSQKKLLLVDGDSDNETPTNNDDEIVESSGAENTASNNEKPITDSPCGFINIFHHNYPVICEVYKDPESELDKVAMVLTMPAGAQNVTIEISDGGDTATIKYKWIQSMYSMRDLFARMMATRQIAIHHPRVMCIKKGLEKSRKRIDTAPEGLIKITLPITVQTSADSWSQNPVKKDDGTLILMADFTGYVKEYTAKIREVDFD